MSSSEKNLTCLTKVTDFQRVEVTDFYNMNSICRICMKGENLQSIYKYKDRIGLDSQDLSQKLTLCCGVEIETNDKMPSSICDVCADALIIAYDLQVLCKATDKILRNMSKKYIASENDHKPNTKVYRQKSVDNINEKQSLDNTMNNFDNNRVTYNDILSLLVEEGDNMNVDFIENNVNGTSSVPNVKNDNKTYKCYACDAKLSTSWERVLHEDSICPNIPPGFIYHCRLCPETASDRKSFDLHIQLAHRGGIQINKQMLLENNLITRGRRRRANECVICEKCGACLKNMSSYLNHTLTHGPKRWLQCKLCSFKTPNKFSYNLHVKFRHLGYELFKCDKCPYKTRRKASLKVHQMRHTGELPYSCNFCPYKAINGSNLKKHLIKHTNSRDYECNICGMCYASKKSLSLHILRIHDHEKIYYCKACRTKYVGKRAYNNHLEKKHAEDDKRRA